MNHKLSYIKTTLTTLFITQTTWYIMLFSHMLTHPILGKTDFLIFYTAERIAKKAKILIYNLGLQKEIQLELVGKNWIEGGVLPFNHPPYLVPITEYLFTQDYLLSFIRWEILLFFLATITSIFTYALFRLNGFNIRTATILTLSAFLFYPLFVCFLKGQDSVLLILGAVIWMYAITKNQQKIAGLALALTTIRPHIALILAFPIFFKYKKVGIYFCVGCAALCLYSFSIIGIQGIKDFYEIIILTANETAYGMNKSSMFNLLGFISRTFPSIDKEFTKVLTWTIYFLAIISISLLWKYSKRDNLILFSTSVIIGIITVPHLHYHDLVLLLIPSICIIIEINRFNHKSTLELEPFFIFIPSLFLLITDITTLRFYGPYVLIMFLAVMLWAPEIRGYILHRQN